MGNIAALREVTYTVRRQREGQEMGWQLADDLEVKQVLAGSLAQQSDIRTEWRLLRVAGAAVQTPAEVEAAIAQAGAEFEVAFWEFLVEEPGQSGDRGTRLWKCPACGRACQWHWRKRVLATTCPGKPETLTQARVRTRRAKCAAAKEKEKEKVVDSFKKNTNLSGKRAGAGLEGLFAPPTYATNGSRRE
eukprot:gene5187-275_t